MMSVAELMEARSAEPVVATVYAKIVSGVRHPTGDMLVVEDSTGQLRVWVPREADVEATGIDTWFAFDIVAEPNSAERFDLSEPRLAATNAAVSGRSGAIGAAHERGEQRQHSRHGRLPESLRGGGPGRNREHLQAD